MTDGAHAAMVRRRGWAQSGPIAGLADWAAAVGVEARRLMAADGADWRCGGTWFAGVNALANGADGGAPALGVPPAPSGLADFAREAAQVGPFAWDPAQISAVTPGYPAPSPNETEAAHRYRVRRDAAHVDGLLRGDGDGRVRRPVERHGFVLGAPVSGGGPGRSPLVVWEGSHELMRAALSARLADVAPADWAQTDVGEAYRAARRRAFETLRRTEIVTAPGEAYLLHRLALHGVAPWRAADPGESGGAGAAPRVIAYFRPDPYPGRRPDWWLSDP